MRTLLSQAHHVVLMIVIGAILSIFGASDGWAQQKYKLSGKIGPESNKYTQQHAIDVGDVPAHQVRIFEIHRTAPKGMAVVNGLRITKYWLRGYTDYTEGNGEGTAYYVYVLENGDKVFARAASVMEAITKRRTMTAVANITGGTGKVLGIRGIIRTQSVFDAKGDFVESEFAGEYWFQK